MDQQFTSNFIKAVSENVKGGKGHYVPVPPGKSRKKFSNGKSQAPTFAETKMDEYPLAKYQQGQRDTCLYSSTACGVHYLRWPQEAHKIHQHGILNPGDPWLLRPWIDMMRQVFPTCQLRKLTEYDILMDDSPFLTMAILIGSDESTDHAICVVGPHIFDPNTVRALPKTRAMLDWCVSGQVEEGVKYVRCLIAYRLEMPSLTKNQRARKRNKKNRNRKMKIKT